MTFLTKLAWFLYNVTTFSSILITVIYWILLYVPGSRVSAVNFFVHGFNSIVSVSDLFIGKRPCRLLHFYHTFLALLAYVAFTVIYWAAGGENILYGTTYIYWVLDWDNLNLTVPFVCIGLPVGVPIGQAILWAVHKLRDHLICCTGNKSSKIQQCQTNPTYDSDEIHF